MYVTDRHTHARTHAHVAHSNADTHARSLRKLGRQQVCAADDGLIDRLSGIERSTQCIVPSYRYYKDMCCCVIAPIAEPVAEPIAEPIAEPVV